MSPALAPVSQGTPDRRLRISWPTVGVLAVVITFVDGFWITSLEGAVGTFARSRSPFDAWVRESLLVLPLFAVMVIAALTLGRRWFGQTRRPLARLAAVGGLLVVATTIAAVGQTTFNAVHDYRIQADGVAKLHTLHPPAPAVDPSSGIVIPASTSCDAICVERRSTAEVHVRSVIMLSGLLLVTNAVLVLWVLLLRGGVVWRRPSMPDDEAPAGVALA